MKEKIKIFESKKFINKLRNFFKKWYCIANCGNVIWKWKQSFGGNE
jgi:hypothetical protein